jgi:hypothetical protein
MICTFFLLEISPEFVLWDYTVLRYESTLTFEISEKKIRDKDCINKVFFESTCVF